MSDSPIPSATNLEYQEVLTRIRNSNAETEKFIAEARKLTRDARLAPLTLAITAFGAGAAMVTAVVAILKVLGP